MTDKVPDHFDLERLRYECEDLGVTLTCYFEYEPEEVGSREPNTGLQMEPDYPETFTLMHVYTPEGLDISPVMKLELLDEIERWAADEMERIREEERAIAAHDRWLSKQYEGGGLR